MSMWLSGANRIAGTIRGQATAQARRQIAAALAKATKDNLKAVFGGTPPVSPQSKPKRRR